MGHHLVRCRKTILTCQISLKTEVTNSITVVLHNHTCHINMVVHQLSRCKRIKASHPINQIRRFYSQRQVIILHRHNNNCLINNDRFCRMINNKLRREKQMKVVKLQLKQLFKRRTKNPSIWNQSYRIWFQQQI